MDLPVVAIVDVGERGGDAAFGHHRVRLAEQRLAHEPDGHAAGRGFDGCSQPRATCADDEDIVLVCLILRHHQILKSDHTPMEQSRTYRSAKPTVNRLHHAHNICLRFRQLTQEYAWTPDACARQLIDAAACDMTQRMTAEQIQAQEDAIDGQNERAYADAERDRARSWDP